MSNRARGAADRTPPNVWGTSASARRRVRRDAQTGRLRPHASGQIPTVREISAGGMVVREHRGSHQVAIIARYNRGGRLEWVLPKGHPEGEEDHHEAAMREVAEETGISGDILTELGHIEYTFTVPGRRIHKTVHHFLLRATGGELTIENDPDQEAVDVAWVDVDRLTGRLTFLNERRIVELAREMMAEFFDITPPPPTIRPRRVVPMIRRLPSGLIPPQFRTDDTEATRKPPTPYELAQKLARAQQQPPQPKADDSTAQNGEHRRQDPEPRAQNNGHAKPTPTEQSEPAAAPAADEAAPASEETASTQSSETPDNLPKDSVAESDLDTPRQPDIPKPSAALFQKRRKPKR